MARARGLRLAVLTATGALGASLITGLASPAAARPGTPPVPEISWGPCPLEAFAFSPVAPSDRYQCGTATVPMDYDDPSGPTIDLALGRLPAADQATKIGTLFVNPGGPGSPGQIPPEISPAVHERFDIVGFDPRGVGASTPLRCFSELGQGVDLLGRPFPVTPEQERDLVGAVARGTDLCGKQGGPLLEHMSTANVARDLDVLRAAVGDDQLNYLAFSYGSVLGATYANLFPNRVRTLVLDGVLDPVEWTTGAPRAGGLAPMSYRVGSFGGARQALDSFLDACERDDRCTFREPGVDLRQKFDRLLERVKQAPVNVPVDGPDEMPDTVVDYQTAIGTTLQFLYHAGDAGALAGLLQELDDAAFPDASPDLLGGLSDQLGSLLARPRYQDAPYLGPEQGLGVQCTDSDNPRDPAAWARFARDADTIAPGFGSYWTYLSLGCATWPVTDEDRYTGPWNTQLSAQPLLIGNSQGDPATPLEGARATAGRLDGARLITLDTFGHTAQGGLSACIDGAVDRYLIDRQLPPDGLSCQPDRSPFDPTPPEVARRIENRLAMTAWR